MVYCHQTTIVCLIVAALLAHSTEANRNCAAQGPGTVNISTAGDFVILAKSGVSTVPHSVITGDVGVSPAAQTYLTGFSLTSDGDTKYSRSTQVTGKLYAADDADPTPAKMTTAIADMMSAYTNANDRTHPDLLWDHNAGLLGGTTLPPGLYKFGTKVSFATNCTLIGSPVDTWIFTITKGMSIATNKHIILAGGALARNIVWAVAEDISFGAGSHFEGIILGATSALFKTGSSINGRVLMQTSVKLQSATVTVP